MPQVSVVGAAERWRGARQAVIPSSLPTPFRRETHARDIVVVTRVVL